MTFLSKAMKIEIFACPSETNMFWQARCSPKMLMPPRKMPVMPEFRGKARMFGAAYARLYDYGFEHFSPKHWRRDARERSLYNRLAGGQQTDMIPFGSAAGGRLGTIGFGTERNIASYAEMVGRGEKPLSRITFSPLSVDRGGFFMR